MSSDVLHQIQTTQFSIDEFLRDYWQKKPVVLRGMFNDLSELLTPDELAGLAGEECLPSRLVMETCGEYPWQVRNGPFEAEDFDELGRQAWSLLVRHVNTVVPPIADLLDEFSFLPSWRIEDVMVSFAPSGGSVGAHVDNYDVFLIQAHGSREWGYGTSPIYEETLQDTRDLRLLKDYTPDEKVVLQPGDVLYLPPRYAHHGIALSDCMTYSVGFRSPTQGELAAEFGEWLDQCCAVVPERFLDECADESYSSDKETEHLFEWMSGALSDRERFTEWFYTHYSQPLVTGIHEPGELALEQFVAEVKAHPELLRKNEGTRVLCRSHSSDSVALYVSGRKYLFSDSLDAVVQLLCGPCALDHEVVSSVLADELSVGFLFTLYKEGDLYLVE